MPITDKPKTYPLTENRLHDVMNERLEQLDVTPYALAKYGGAELSHSTLYRFLRGNHGISSDKLEQLLAACGFALVVVDEHPDWIE